MLFVKNIFLLFFKKINRGKIWIHRKRVFFRRFFPRGIILKGTELVRNRVGHLIYPSNVLVNNWITSRLLFKFFQKRIFFAIPWTKNIDRFKRVDTHGKISCIFRLFKCFFFNFTFQNSSNASGPVHHLDTPFETATFGMGCFWGAESLFGGTHGVLRTKVGYSGGTKPNPQYRNL